MPSHDESLAVAEKLTQAFSSLNADRFNELYADDAVIWHASTNQVQTKAENVGLLRGVFALMRKAGYEEIKRIPTPDGFVQYHVIRGTFTDGQPVPELHACMVIDVRDGKITRLREWFDAAQFGEVWKRMGIAL